MISGVNNNGVDLIRSYLPKLPDLPGVYKMIDCLGHTIYIGKANNLRKRVAQYININSDVKRTIVMVSQVCAIDFMVTNSEAEALTLEARLIRSLQPKYNVLLKDDKSYPFLVLDLNNDFPRIFQVRSFGLRLKKGNFRVFGPFNSARAAYNLINLIQKICQIRPCNDVFFQSRKRPCVEYQINRCSAPCVAKITTEAYRDSVNRALLILSGNSHDVIHDLNSNMQHLSETEDYDRAIVVRDRIIALEQLNEKNAFDTQNIGDYLGFARVDDYSCIQLFRVGGLTQYGDLNYFLENTGIASEGEVISTFITRNYLLRDFNPVGPIFVYYNIEDKNILEEALLLKYGRKIPLICSNDNKIIDFIFHLNKNAEVVLNAHLGKQRGNEVIFQKIMQIFSLPNPIKVIEVLDNSHTSGGSPVGVVIAVTNNGFDRSRYRLFNTDLSPESDDYGMMRDVLLRRFQGGNLKHPDLLLIDGGRGHLKVVHEVLNSLNINIPCICIAKGKQRKSGKERFYKKGSSGFCLKGQDDVLHFLQKIRDEAHRFAITSHRRRRSKVLLKGKTIFDSKS